MTCAKKAVFTTLVYKIMSFPPKRIEERQQKQPATLGMGMGVFSCQNNIRGTRDINRSPGHNLSLPLLHPLFFGVNPPQSGVYLGRLA